LESLQTQLSSQPVKHDSAQLQIRFFICGDSCFWIHWQFLSHPYLQLFGHEQSAGGFDFGSSIGFLS